MSDSEETSNNAKNDAVLQAIAELSKTVGDLSNKFDNLENRFGNLEKFVTAQFDALQEGIAYNSAAFDRLESKFFDARSDIANMRADIKELTQAVRKREVV